MGVATLIITDGSTTVDLLATGYGFHLADWAQAITGYKGGGTVQDSPLADGRRLVDKKFVDGIEVFTLALNQSNQDALADDIQDLLRLLEQATDYWAGWYNTPVYLEVKWTNETNARRAIIKNYQLGNLPNPYGQPFLQANCAALYNEFTLTIERGPWTSNTPGTETATQAGVTSSFGGRTLGNVDSTGTASPTTTNNVFVGNKHNIANLTHVYNYDDSLATFSANLMDAALPYTLWPAAGVAVNDLIYFGIETIANSGPFSNLIFDIGTAAGGEFTIVFEYWSGATWSTLTVLAYTNTGNEQQLQDQLFSEVAQTTVSWKLPSNWATTSINGVTAYWVRARVSVIPSSFAPQPQQQNRDIYSVTWPYTRITSDQVLGDLPALLRFRFTQRNGNLTDSVTSANIASHRVIVALRSESRSITFTPFINCSDEQQPSGAVAAAKTNTTVGNDTTTPTGRRYTYQPLATEAMATRLVLSITGTDYIGTFRIFLRAQQAGGSVGDVLVRIGLDNIGAGNTDNVIFYTSTLSFTNTGRQELLDFGQITLPGVPVAPNDGSLAPGINLRIQASAASATPALYLYDLILMPVDEWSGEFLDPLQSAATELIGDVSLDADSVLDPKETIRSFTRNASGVTFGIEGLWRNIVNGPAILQANANQRLWCLAARYDSGAWYADFEILSATQVTRNQRYFSARGDR